jgi:regulator of replication initiation timing
VTDSDKKTKYLTLGQAAKETGRSKSTIFKAIQNGTLSYIEKTSAGYKLDRDEVFLLFPANDLSVSIGEHSRTTNENTENDFLKRENDLLRQQIDDLRRRLDDEAAERRKLTLLLTHQTEPKAEQPTRSRLYEKLFGRR